MRGCGPWHVGARLVACGVLAAACDVPTGGEAWPAFRDGPTCGDGLVDAGEACDLGSGNRPDGSCRDCRLPTCGDGVRDVGEDCDDGDDDDTDACRSDCRATLREEWSRRWNAGAPAQRVSDLVVDAGGDAIVVGFRDAGTEARVRPWAARYAPSGDVRWSVALGELGVAHAIAQREDGDLVVAVTSAPQPHEAGDVRVLQLRFADGGVGLDVAPAGESGRAAAIATAGDAVFVAYNAVTGPGRVLGLDAAGAVASGDVIAQVPLFELRALATLPGGDLLVAGGQGDTASGFVARVSASGEPRFAVELDGPVIDVVADGDGALAALTATVDAPEPAEPWTWSTAVEVVALAPDGGARWSRRLAPTRGRREAGAIAREHDRILVVGSDPPQAATCSPNHCEQRPWAAALDPEDGVVRWELVLDPSVQGRAHAVGVRESAVVVGGDVRPLFSAAEGWISARQEVAP